MKDQIRRGISPLKEKSSRRKYQVKTGDLRITLARGWNDFVDKVLINGTRKQDQRPYSDSHKKNAVRSMGTHVLPILGHRHPLDISKREWLILRDEHAAQRPSEWRQIRAYITACYKWMMETSPYMNHVHGLPYFGPAPKSAVRTRQLRDVNEIRAIWDCTNKITPPQAGLAVRFLLLSNRRIGEVRQMTIDQIDFNRMLWHHTPMATKSRIEFYQALTPLMCELIKQGIGERNNGYVFSSTNGKRKLALGSKVNNSLVSSAKISHVSFNDFRRTISNGLLELRIDPRIVTKTEGKLTPVPSQISLEMWLPEHQREAYLTWEQHLGLGRTEIARNQTLAEHRLHQTPAFQIAVAAVYKLYLLETNETHLSIERLQRLRPCATAQLFKVIEDGQLLIERRGLKVQNERLKHWETIIRTGRSINTSVTRPMRKRELLS